MLFKFIESQQRVAETNSNSYKRSKSGGIGKPFIMLMQWKYARNVTLKLISGFEKDKNCWK